MAAKPNSALAEAAKLWPALGRYRKLVAALAVSTGPLVTFLLAGPHSAAEIFAASWSWVLVNLGVYGATND